MDPHFSWATMAAKMLNGKFADSRKRSGGARIMDDMHAIHPKGASA